MHQNDTVAVLRNAAFGPDSAFSLLESSIRVGPFLRGVDQLVVDEASFNAFAEQNADTDLVAVNSGTLRKVTEKIEELEGFLSTYQAGSNLRTQLWWDELDDAEVKLRLSRLCIDFIVFHEISHIALNHCMVTPTSEQPSRLYEMPSRSVHPDTSVLSIDGRHAFELFADKLSAAILSGFLPRLISMDRRFRFNHPSAAWMGLTWAMQIVWAIMAESSADYLTEQMAFLTAMREGRATSEPWFTHPHPSLRRAVAADSLRSFKRGWVSDFLSGFLRRDSEVAIENFLSRDSRSLGALATSSKVVAGYKRKCNTAWRGYRDHLLPTSRFQSAMFVRDVLKRHGWDRTFMVAYKKESKRQIEEMIAASPPLFRERNVGKLPRDHEAHEL